MTVAKPALDETPVNSFHRRTVLVMDDTVASAFLVDRLDFPRPTGKEDHA
ncbi:hypothetical protein [Streptomyces botrytidirepellens]|nr:hypothetical protein [Streptomyces botrytidirepellens]